MNTNANICGVKFGNTGTNGCALDISQINGLVIIPEGKTYSMSTYATDAAFLTALKADTLLAAKGSRIYPYFNVIDCVDNTAANAVQSTGYGIQQYTEAGKPMLVLTLDERGIRQLQNFARFSGNRALTVAICDKKGGWYWKKLSSGLNAGMPVSIDAEAFKVPVGTSASEKKVNLYFKEEDAFTNGDKFDFYKFDAGTMLKDELSGVHDVKLSLVSASAAAIVIKVQRADNLLDLGIAYATALAQIAAYSLVLASTGAAVTISTATYSATAGTITLAGTFTTALHYLALKDPTVLAALATPLGNGQTGGFESNVLSVTPA